MFKDTRIIVIGLFFVFLLVVGGSFWLVKGSQKEVLNIKKEAVGIETAPELIDLGNVPITGGTIIREYEFKNLTSTSMKLRKIATSCMCTTASVTISDKTTGFFSMEGSGINPLVNLDLGPGESGKVTFRFDPAAHGPKGIGPFDRSILLTFTNPEGLKEFKFKGAVVK